MLYGIGEVFFSGLTLIEVRSDPGVDDQFAYGEIVKDIDEVVELVRVIVAEPGLYGNLHVLRFGITVDVIQELLEFKRLRQEACTLALGTDRA